MKKEWLCLIVATGIFYCCTGQSLVSSNTILSSAREDMKPGLQNQRLQYIEETNHRLPFIEQISIRTETDRFDIDRQEYLARMSVNGISEMHHVKELQAVELTVEQKTQRVYLHEALVDRYEAVASINQVLQELSLHQELQLVYADKITVLKKQAQLNLKPDLEELIKAEYDLDEENLKIDAFLSQLQELKQFIGILAPLVTGDWQLDTTQFVSPAHIELILDQLSPTVIQNPTLEQKQTEVEEVNLAYDLEKASSNQMLDYLQVRYAGRPENFYEQEFTIGAGFLLPFKGSSRVKLSGLQIKMNDADQEAQIYEEELKREMTIALQKVKALAVRYRLGELQWKDSQASFTLEQYGVAQSEGPFLLLNAKEMQVKRQLSLLDIQRDMLEQYLKILDWSGYLSAEPQVNYLSANLETY
jgi:hypothetical protein